ncbi:MAG: hypothetical protein C4320_03625 [Armatimonadota bacterium]
MVWMPNGSFALAPTNSSAIPAPASTLLLVEHRNPESLTQPWWEYAVYWENWVWGTGSANTEPNTPTDYYGGIDYSNANKAAFGYADTHVATRPKGYLFPGHERRKSAGDVMNSAPGSSCTDASEWDSSPVKKCALPDN